MRPSSSSSSDPNAPYRAAIASLVDCNFFVDDGAEQPETVAANSQQTPFTGLNPGPIVAQSNRPNTTSEVGTSTASPVTVGTIQQYLHEKGYPDSRLMDLAIRIRLNSANLSAGTLLSALQITHDANHSLLASLSVSNQEREILISKLVGILINTTGFRGEIKNICQNCNNNPNYLIANLLQYLRSH